MSGPFSGLAICLSALTLGIALSACATSSQPEPASGTIPPPASEPLPSLQEAGETAMDAMSEALDTGFAPTLPECIVPANPGDGSDFVCRSVAQVLAKLGLLKDELQITNLAGAGGTVAYTQAAQSRKDDDNLIIAASPATTLHLAQGRYDPLTADDVRWLGVVGVDYGVIAVPAASPLTALGDLMELLAAEPEALRFGGGGPLDGQDYVKLSLLMKAGGIEMSNLLFSPFEGGGDALSALSMGFVDVFPGDLSEVIEGVESGELRLLAILTPERLESFPDTPTAIEQGFDAQWISFRGFYAPGEMSDEAFAWWSNALEEMAGTPEWAETRSSVGMDEFFMTGDEFDEMIEAQIETFAGLDLARQSSSGS